jgi:hypothetical protein
MPAIPALKNDLNLGNTKQLNKDVYHEKTPILCVSGFDQYMM